MTPNQLPDHFFKQIVETNWVAVMFADLKGNITYANNSACSLYGFEKKEMTGMLVDFLNADDFLNTETILNDILHEKKWSGEMMQKKKNGDVFPAFLTVSLVNDEEGNPYGFVSNSKDLTLEKEAEKNIKESGDTLKLLLDSLPIGIFILDHQGKPFYANNFTKVFAKQTHNLRIEDLDAMDKWEVFKQNTDTPYPFDELPINRALRGEKSNVTDLDIVLQNSRYHVSATAQPVYVNDKIKFSVSAFLDISEILNKQEEIERRENEIQALINSHDFYFFSVDKNHQVIRYNNAFKTRVESLGIDINGFNVKTIIPGEQLKEIEALYKTAFSGENVIDVRQFDAEESKQIYETKYAPIFRGEEVYAVSVISQNITKRLNNEVQLKEALCALSRRESEISSIINNTDAMILSIDKKYNVIECNNAFQQMVSKIFLVDDVKRTPMLNYIVSQSHAYVISLCARAFNGETVVDEYDYPTSNGRSVFETRYNPIVNNGEVIAISIFSQDVSSRKNSEKQLKAALDEKELLLNEVHHRVKNNLAIISSLLQLEELKTSNEEIKDILISSRNRIKSTALVHQFLYQNDSIEKIKFSEYVKEFINQIEKSLTTNKQIAISINGDDFDLGIEQAIPCGLILNELFTNSVKHAFPTHFDNAIINIHYLKKDNEVQLTFLDNGVGFDEEIAMTNSLGLTVVRTLVKQLRGTVSINTKKGAVFIICFPV